MTEFASVFSENFKKISQTFLIAFYLPGAYFLAVHLFLFFPLWPLQSLPITLPGPTLTSLDISQLVVLFALPALVGVVLLGLNHEIVVLYEGRSPLLKYSLLWPWYQRQLRRYARQYEPLSQLRTEYQRQTIALATAASPEAVAQIQGLLGSLQQQIHSYETTLEQQKRVISLPLHRERICPTAFGNAYALAEEYALERYGIDTVLFWPRLRDLLDTHATTLSERLSQQKTRLDMVLNLSLLSGILVVECLLSVLLLPTNHWLFLAIGGIAAFMAFAFYAESVRAVHIQGELIKASFDLYRHLLLQAFRLRRPAQLLQEQMVWLRLAAFIRRGHAFYFPDDMIEEAVDGSSQ